MGVEEHTGIFARADRYREEAAIVQLSHPSRGKKIDLVGAVHIGSHEYYATVKSILMDYDAVLYEGVSRLSQHLTLRDRFIYFNRLLLGEFHRGAAEAVTSRYFKRIDQAVEGITEEELGEVTLQEYKDMLKKGMERVSQGDAINYDSLPPNWYRADLTGEELSNHTGIFSKENIGWIWWGVVFNAGLRFPKVMEYLARCLMGGRTDVLPGMTSKTDLMREQRVYDLAEKLFQAEGIDRLGVWYGVEHLRRLEQGFIQRGYKRDSMEYIEVSRMFPFLLEKFERNDGASVPQP